MKRKLWQSLLAVLFAAATTRNVLVLDDHDVPASTLVFVTVAMVGLGAEIVRWAGAPRVRTFRCTADGCGLEVRTTAQDPETEAAYEAIALDHAQHGQAVAR